MYLFVYGTLKRGHGNHRVLGDAKYVCDAALPFHKMYSLGGFPGVIPQHNEGPISEVHGEVYEIEDKHLPNLDGLEGYDPKRDDGMYVRRKVIVHPYEMVKLKAYTYIWNRDIPKEDRRIEDGIWRR